MKFENDGLDLLPELGLGNTPWRQIVQLEVLTFVTLFFWVWEEEVKLSISLHKEM